MTEAQTVDRIQDLLELRTDLLVKIEINRYDREKYHKYRKKLIEVMNELERLQS